MIIGITGKARAGKDTLGTYLGEEFNRQINSTYVLMSYATELKNRVQKDFDLSWEQLWGDEKEKMDKRYSKDDFGSFWTPREILQNYGQFFRTIDINYWVKALFSIIDEKNYKNVIITDCRHPNEIMPIIERQGIIIKISRPDQGAAQQPDHISETALDDFDQTLIDFNIDNSAVLQNLKQEAVRMVPLINKFHKIKIREGYENA